MFACAILDVRARRLFLARDPFGIKPLYYVWSASMFAFASEIKALLDLGVRRTANPERLYVYLRHGLTDHGAEPLFTEIHQLPAAHYLEMPLQAGTKATPVQYWAADLTRRHPAYTFDEAVERLRELFLQNIRLHLRSDVPVGAALSGGIDSSSIVGAIRHIGGSKLALHTFTHVA